VIIGKDSTIDLLLIALIAKGHLLLEDVPGTGKTVLAKTMAASMHGEFRRIQFTPDLLPSDISGMNIYNQKTAEFSFIAGPIFANLVLADEINRATPRTQSSLLECMEEYQVTTDGLTRKINPPFMVIATQNPVETQGTFPLPEAQLDRFLIKTSMNYPSNDEMTKILKRFEKGNPLNTLEAVVSQEDMVQAQDSFHQVTVCDELYHYISAICEKSRQHPDTVLGVSPRGAQALLKTSQVKAILEKRDYVIPDDVKAMCEPVLAHRIMTNDRQAKTAKQVICDILKSVPVPSEEAFIQKISEG
jgi:MoxR-like ATPase